MDNEQPSSIQSICHVRASELFPKRQLEGDDKHLQVPFKTICGEAVVYLGRTADGILALSNYRIYLQLKDTYYNIPLGLVENIEIRDIFHIYIGCKDARSLRCTFSTNQHCQDWFRRLIKATSSPKQIEDVFAFAFHAWASEEGGEEVRSRLSSKDSEHDYFKNEVERLKFDVNGAWRISDANSEYKLCSSYPRRLLVPACITDKALESAAKFRSSRRVPAVVWRHTGNGAVIARCSQPEVGWLGWRSSEDEDLIGSIADACAFDKGRNTAADNRSEFQGEGEANAVANGADHASRKKVLIMDARSYTTAVANRARGGGCECPEYYPRCEIQFMSLANIHSIRKSFHAVRQLCSLPDTPNWLSMLENSRWLQHMAGLVRAAVVVTAAVEREARPVLVHCSDGWDRTPQIVALAQILLDPYYRTIEGFQTLVEREWLDFGHKFGDRCGHSVSNEDVNERCPVFLQWLDCIHQLLNQFPCSFQYSQDYLVTLAQHTYSNLFGTFLCNSSQERSALRVSERTFSVWKFLESPKFQNHLYSDVNQVLWPSCNVRDLVLWTEVYIGSLEAAVTKLPSPAEETLVASGMNGFGLNKTRSYDDIMTASLEESQSLTQGRRSSHPNIATESKIESLQLTNSDIDALLSPLENHVINGQGEGEEENLSSRAVYMNGSSLSAKGLNESVDGLRDSRVNDKKNASDSEEDDEGEREEEEEDEEEVVGDEEEEEEEEDSATETWHLESAVMARQKLVETNNNNRINSNNNSSYGSENEGDVMNGVCGDGVSIRRKNRTISEELYENFVNKSDTTFDVCGSLEKLNSEVRLSSSVVSSTDTLVNGVNTTTSSSSCGGDSCRVCTHAPGKKESNASNSTSGRNSRYSTPPLYSRTPSSGYPATPIEPNGHHHPRCRSGSLDIDGLQHCQDDIQARVSQIIGEHKTKEQALEKELHTTRLALIQQVCHNCPHGNAEEIVSRPESMCSERNPSSIPSDQSWEAVDESDTKPTLWVPDHAVARCQGCDVEFWIGRRKHHCRNCGKVFCSDCSENTAALPGEQLYEPVRVCNRCHTLLASFISSSRLVKTETCKKASGSGAENGKMASSKTATT